MKKSKIIKIIDFLEQYKKDGEYYYSYSFLQEKVYYTREEIADLCISYLKPENESSIFNIKYE